MVQTPRQVHVIGQLGRRIVVSKLHLESASEQKLVVNIALRFGEFSAVGDFGSVHSWYGSMDQDRSPVRQ